MPTVRFQLRRDTAANWTATNPVLGSGEPALETDTKRVKYGDGSSPWTALAYAPGNVTAFMLALLESCDDAAELRGAAGLNRSVFRAHKNGSNQALTGGATAKVTFGTEEFDQNGYYNAANSRYTPPAGPVIIRAQICMVSGFAAGDRMFLFIYKNGANKAYATSTFPTANAVSDTVELIDVANGTDYYEIYISASAAGSTPVINGPAATTWFEGYSI